MTANPFLFLTDSVKYAFTSWLDAEIKAGGE